MPSKRKRLEREREAGRRRRRTLGAAGFAVALVFAVAVGASQLSDRSERPGVSETGAVEVVGAPLPVHAAGDDPAIGMPAPSLTGRSFDGTAVRIGDDGTPTAIWFLAHWCPHCQVEVPKIVDLVAGGAIPSGVELYSVSTGADPGAPNYPPSAWLEREGWTIPVLVDDGSGEAATVFGLDAFPFLVLVDGDGRVVSRTTGELEPAAITGMLQELAAAG